MKKQLLLFFLFIALPLYAQITKRERPAEWNQWRPIYGSFFTHAR